MTETVACGAGLDDVLERALHRLQLCALLVRPGFEPVPRLDVLPKVGGYVLARTIVEGVRDSTAAQ